MRGFLNLYLRDIFVLSSIGRVAQGIQFAYAN